MQDMINGIFEIAAGILIWANCYRVYKDKQVKGVSLLAVSVFVLWGYWNLYYYPFLGQWLSFIGGIMVVTANTVWVGMMMYYVRKEKKREPPRLCKGRTLKHVDGPLGNVITEFGGKPLGQQRRTF